MSKTHLFLFKRSNGIWYIHFKENERSRWKSTGTKSKSDALQKLTTFEKLVENKPQNRSLSQFVTDFLSYARVNRSPATVEIFKRCLNHLRTIAGDGCSISSLTAEHADKFKSKRLQGNVSPQTVNLEMRALRAIMNIALRWTLIKENPFSRIQLCKIPETSPKFLSRDDFKKLFDIVEEIWLKEIIVFAILTGLRRAEITNLKWTNVDFTRKVISIESSPTFMVKSGKKRIVPMNEMVFQILESKYKERRTEYVFALNDKKIMDDWITRLFKWYVRKACLDDKLKFHSLRASFASWLVMDGVPIYAVSKLLGHSDVTITQKHYAHLAPENLHDEVNRISIPR